MDAQGGKIIFPFLMFQRQQQQQKQVQQTSPTARARNYFTENGYNASTMRIASKIRQQERYEKGLREIRQHEERKRVKSEIGRVASATRAKYVRVRVRSARIFVISLKYYELRNTYVHTRTHRYEFEKRAQIRQDGALRRAALNGKRQLPATRLRCFEGNIPFLNPNLEKMLSRRVMESGGGGVGESK